jgi:hypothetical protein
VNDEYRMSNDEEMVNLLARGTNKRVDRLLGCEFGGVRSTLGDGEDLEVPLGTR